MSNWEGNLQGGSELPKHVRARLAGEPMICIGTELVGHLTGTRAVTHTRFCDEDRHTNIYIYIVYWPISIQQSTNQGQALEVVKGVPLDLQIDKKKHRRYAQKCEARLSKQSVNGHSSHLPPAYAEISRAAETFLMLSSCCDL